MSDSWVPPEFEQTPVVAPPSPWGPLIERQELLLTHIGFAADCTHCQVVSENGVSVFTLPALLIVHNEPNTGLGIAFPNLIMDGVGPLAGQRLPFAGRFGGGFSYRSGDNWYCEPLSIGPLNHAVFVKPPENVFEVSADLLSNRYQKIYEGDPVIAAGFCTCDNHLTIATSRSFAVSTRRLPE